MLQASRRGPMSAWFATSTVMGARRIRCCRARHLRDVIGQK